MELELNLRPLAETDRPAVRQALIEAYEKAKGGKAWIAQYSLDEADDITDLVFDFFNVDSCIVNDTYLLCYSVGSKWFSKHKYFTEELILRLNKNKIPFSFVVEGMTAIAKVNDCCGIYVGTALSRNDQVYVSKLKKYGFEQDTVSLFKPIN